MRLIDADEVITVISNHHFDEDKNNFDLLIHNLCKEVKKIPTAYNPEKVVEELKEKQEKWKTQLQENDTNFLDHEILKQYVKHYDDAIDIVKRGDIYE